MKANEAMAFYMPKDLAFEDRQIFVKNLGELLNQTREEVIKCELDENEIVTVYFKNGYTKKVNVRMDSYLAIIRDVTKGI